MKYTSALCIMTAGLLILASCGSMTPQQKLVGTWEAEMFGEIMTVVFHDNGTVWSVEEEEMLNWEIIDGDPLILKVWDPDRRADAVELELVFDGNDKATLSAEGMTSTMERIE